MALFKIIFILFSTHFLPFEAITHGIVDLCFRKSNSISTIQLSMQTEINKKKQSSIKCIEIFILKTWCTIFGILFLLLFSYIFQHMNWNNAHWFILGKFFFSYCPVSWPMLQFSYTTCTNQLHYQHTSYRKSSETSFFCMTISYGIVISV